MNHPEQKQINLYFDEETGLWREVSPYHVEMYFSTEEDFQNFNQLIPVVGRLQKEEIPRFLEAFARIGGLVGMEEACQKAEEKAMVQGYTYSMHNPDKRIDTLECPECTADVEPEDCFCRFCGQRLKSMDNLRY